MKIRGKVSGNSVLLCGNCRTAMWKHFHIYIGISLGVLRVTTGSSNGSDLFAVGFFFSSFSAFPDQTSTLDLWRGFFFSDIKRSHTNAGPPKGVCLFGGVFVWGESKSINLMFPPLEKVRKENLLHHACHLQPRYEGMEDKTMAWRAGWTWTFGGKTELKHDNLLPFLKSPRRSLWDVSLVPILPLGRSLGWPLAAHPSSP